MIRLTRAQLREIDRLATEKYGIPSIVLMENAAIGATRVAVRMLGTAKSKVLICCGSGNNGGDGLAIARHLDNAGSDVRIAFVGDAQAMSPDCATNYQIARKIQLPFVEPAPAEFDTADLVVDALFGTGLTRAPMSAHRSVIDEITRCNALKLAIDVPSGLDCDAGTAPGVCVHATRTVTFVAEKIGFPRAIAMTGDVEVVGIGAPKNLIEEVAGRSPPSPRD